MPQRTLWRHCNDNLLTERNLNYPPQIATDDTPTLIVQFTHIDRMRQKIDSSSVNIMACRLLNTNPLPESKKILSMKYRGKIQTISMEISKLFWRKHSEMSVKYIFLFRSWCVPYSPTNNWLIGFQKHTLKFSLDFLSARRHPGNWCYYLRG